MEELWKAGILRNCLRVRYPKSEVQIENSAFSRATRVGSLCKTTVLPSLRLYCDSNPEAANPRGYFYVSR